MIPQKRSNKLSSWLSKLDRESWNPELVISGFSIFLLFQALEPAKNLFKGSIWEWTGYNPTTTYLLTSMLNSILTISIKILIFNLLVHIFLRGFWIGAIGLRSVQKDLSFSALNYSSFFTKKLRKNTLTLDVLIIRLDKFCSTIFAFTYTVMLMLISLGIWMIVMGFLGSLFNHFVLVLLFEDRQTLLIPLLLLLLLVILFLLGSLIYFIDTVSLGFFKRYKRLSRWYYPLYVFYSTISFSWVYRPFYYALANTKHKNWLRFFLFIYLFIPFSSGFFFVNSHMYFDVFDYYEHQFFYEDQREADDNLSFVNIPSEIVQGTQLPVFIKYIPMIMDDLLKEECPDYQPVFSRGIKSVWDAYKAPVSNPDSLLNKCLPTIFDLRLNEKVVDSLRFQFYINDFKEYGYRTVIDLSNCKAGYNELKVFNYQIPFYLDR